MMPRRQKKKREIEFEAFISSEGLFTKQLTYISHRVQGFREFEWPNLSFERLVFEIPLIK